ncbi:MAG: porin [Alcanivoracaceae bacterium]|jgi:predicted porin|nr:porin [Alcanivoracaceae bacterium]
MTVLHRLTIGILAASFSAATWAEELDDRLAQAEARLAALEAQSLSSEKFRFNGFLTLGMERTSSITGVDPILGPDQSISYRESDSDSWNLRQYSRAGFRVETDINDRTGAVLQILARGENDYDAELQWAYISYAITPELTWRAGRLVLPTYMHSQYTQASYAYPWIELPSQVYGTLPVDTMEGMDLTWQFNTGKVGHALNVTWGATDVTTVTGRYIVNNQGGINLKSYIGDFSTRISYSMGQTELALPDLTALGGADLTPFSLDNHYGYFASVGGQYDNGSLLVLGEVVQLGVNAPYSWFPTQTAAYLTAGYRVGKLMPHLTWSTVDSDSDDRCAASPDPASCAGFVFQNTARSKSWTLGARYDLDTGIALKAEASRFYDFTSGATVNGSLFSGLPTSSDPIVFRLAVDAAF